MNLGNFGKLTIVYAVAALLLIIELGFTAYLVDQTDNRWWGGAPSQIAFMLFNSIWSILVLIYLAVTPPVLPSLYIPVVALGLLALTSLFWFAGSIALAVLIGIPHCDGNNTCHVAQAAVVFGFFNWLLFTGLAIWEGMGFARGRNSTAAKPTPYAGA